MGYFAIAVAEWPPLWQLLLLGRRWGTKIPCGNAGAEGIDHIQNAQRSVRCALEIRDCPRIGFQPFKALARDRIDDCAVAVFQVD